MLDELVYEIALTQVPGIGAVQAKQLIEHFGDAQQVFRATKKALAQVDGIGEIRAKAIKSYKDFEQAIPEIEFCQKHHIQILTLWNPAYPQRLLHCYDAPSVLFYRGNADLNNSKVISIIGTRLHTEYGKNITEQIVAELQPYQVLITSGLAFGIDSIAHRAALQQQLPTVGVLAHGLSSIYPKQHKSLAKEMLQLGGLLTEFGCTVIADKHNFPKRNRIVAGMSDATIVIETATKGGSMITAELANNYNRDVFAVPGKITDSKSSGCLKLIQQNKAIIFTSAAQLLDELGWQTKKIKVPAQRSLFIDLTEEEKILVSLLQQKDTLPIDALYLHSGLSSSSVAAAILNLELQNVITALPGKMYRLN
ncbi:MAG: DNA-protecting protein DprA [Sphingobacteriales bacterium]|uniref:DNA-processing protein DprA n=1 Tax=Hydrotalea flava TaxID=714549 RepID=UPI00082FE768|nr:DNA-processing protein DprA [Hydrotalea flava]RTL51575.1 MAG: DNA-protecting protein DprA [Sphingobacteriales bacterium]